MNKKIELLAPAGDLNKLKIAILYGADSVYIGGKKFSLRARASNFTEEDIKQACIFAKKHHAKIYVTMNILPHNDDLEGLMDYLLFLESVGVDAIITSSIYIIKTCLEITPSIEVHLSTQLSTINSQACNFYYEMGIKRVVLGRETTLLQMEQIRKNTDVSLEAFIHGGMCSAFSGRCMLSNHMVNRDANRGGCAHSCRWNYDLYDNGEKINKCGNFNIASKDLVGVSAIKKMIDIGIDCFKIEGRMKSDYYIATVVSTYRKLIDDILKSKMKEEEYYKTEISKAENRLSSTGFLFGEVSVEQQLYDRDDHPTKEFIGIVKKYDMFKRIAYIEQRNYFAIGDTIEFFGPKYSSKVCLVDAIFDEDNNLLEAARHPKQLIKIKVPFFVKKNDMVRLISKKR